MDSSPSTFQRLMGEARAGSEDAYTQLVETYAPHVRRVLKRQMSVELRAKVDEEDLAQMVWASFFQRKSNIIKFEESGKMIAFLRGIAANKLKKQARHYGTDKRSLNREQPLADQVIHSVFLEADTPSQFAINREEKERVLAELDERDRGIVLLWLEGATYEEIAEQFEIGESRIGKIVRDVLRKFRKEGK